MPVKILLLAASILIAAYIFYEGTQTNFQPRFRTRVLMFGSGFAVGFCGAWLADAGTLWHVLWLKLALGVACGLSSAFVLPERWYNIKSRVRRKE
jgi:hypothetical protein